MFESGRAKRERLIVSCAIVGWPNSGKTLSSIRLATGMLRARPGKIVVVDSNLRRSLYYADDYEFDVVHLTPPFSSERWRSAYQQALGMGATIIVGDCMSDEHEGEGGVLDSHEREVDRLVDRAMKKKPDQDEWAARDRLSQGAWRSVKRDHLDLRLWMLQQRVDWILTYRAKQKVDMANKNELLGWQPVGGADIIADLTFKCLLPPMSDGKPDWKPNLPAEKLLVKNPQHMREMLTKYPQLNEDLGELIARWANGGDSAVALPVVPQRPASQPSSRPAAQPSGAGAGSRSSGAERFDFKERFDACETPEAFKAIGADMRAAWNRLDKPQRDAAVAAEKRAESLLKRALAAGMTPAEMREIDRIEHEENRP